ESEMTQEWVDLGLPGGTLFATCNVGATTPQEYGGYYAFGDLEEKDYKNYVVGNGSFKENENLPLEADVAHVVLGGKWRMPTSDELFNIKKTCPRYWTSTYNGKGVYGMIIYKPKGKDIGVNYEYRSVNSSNESYSIKDPHIFLPAAGYVFNGSKSDVSLKGNYRSSTYEDNNYAYQLNIASTTLNHGSLSRWYGYSVRPVYDKNL
ncbi:MAG: hypothetical protein KBT27_05930, partial [Prevotellaceae bacterium]|nr:hypothetical protein [Candidatus Faecinaster equi]